MKLGFDSKNALRKLNKMWLIWRPHYWGKACTHADTVAESQMLQGAPECTAAGWRGVLGQRGFQSTVVESAAASQLATGESLRLERMRWNSSVRKSVRRVENVSGTVWDAITMGKTRFGQGTNQSETHSSYVTASNTASLMVSTPLIYFCFENFGCILPRLKLFPSSNWLATADSSDKVNLSPRYAHLYILNKWLKHF